MSIPLLVHHPRSQNQRVAAFEVPGDEHSRIFTTDNLLCATDMDTLILAAYRQICNEQQMLGSYRHRFLESQLRAGQITVKDFIRGIATSGSFRNLVYDHNNNYRFVQICIQRILGRNVYDDREKMAWSIVLATKGLQGFIDALLNSDEYQDNFGDNIVPYQRRRILPQHSNGELPFSQMARYDEYHLAKLPKQSAQGFSGASKIDYVRWEWQKNPPKPLVQVGKAIIFAGVGAIGLLCFSVLFGL
jgi:phycobilisome rod-core linker protein